MNLDLLKLGFATIRIVDVIDILLVATVFFYLWRLTRTTRASRMWIGLLLLLAFGMLARLLNLRALSWILESLSAVWAVAFVILFQPELRRALSDLGRTPWSRRHVDPNLPDILARACTDLSNRRWGAIMVLHRRNSVSHYIETGVTINAAISSELLVNLFAPGTPLHDGAVVIDGEYMIAARCVLPVQVSSDQPLGMRHRAAFAASQETDAVVLVVSEETGKVSIAADGTWLLFRGEASEIVMHLTQMLGTKKT